MKQCNIVNRETNSMILRKKEIFVKRELKKNT